MGAQLSFSSLVLQKLRTQKNALPRPPMTKNWNLLIYKEPSYGCPAKISTQLAIEHH